MSHRENQQKNFRRATNGLPDDYQNEVHRILGKHCYDRKDDMDFDELLDVVKDVMDNHPGWKWDGQKWREI